MKTNERGTITGLVALLLLLWLGFLLHRSPRFAGSAWGGVLGVSGALLMLWPLGYSLVKRVPKLKAVVMRRVSMSTLLAWHVYTGVLGAILGILHTGHKFNSALGVALTTLMFASVLSGYIGRHFLGFLSHELGERKTMLAQLQTAYQQTASELAQQPNPALTAVSHAFFKRAAFSLFGVGNEAEQGQLALSARALRLAESIADLEYAVASDELIKRRFGLWLKLHIATSLLFYGLLALHVWAGVYYGLRWFA